MSDRVPDLVLLDRLAKCPAVGSVWLHRSGFRAVVTGRAIEESTLHPLVLCRHADDASAEPVVWARTLANFRERFTPADKEQE